MGTLYHWHEQFPSLRTLARFNLQTIRGECHPVEVPWAHVKDISDPDDIVPRAKQLGLVLGMTPEVIRLGFPNLKGVACIVDTSASNIDHLEPFLSGNCTSTVATAQAFFRELVPLVQ